MGKQWWRRGLTAALIGLAILGGLRLMGFGLGAADHRDPWPADSTPERTPDSVTVTAAPVILRPVQRAVEAVGTLHGFEEITISSKVEGRVQKLLHDVADRVKPGELLLEVDATDHRLFLQQEEKALEVELAKLGLKEPPEGSFNVENLPSVVQAKVVMENAQSRLRRAQAASVAVAREEVTNLTADFQAAQAQYLNQVLQARAALATIRLKQDGLSIARQRLEDTRILTPVLSSPLPGDPERWTFAVTSRTVSEGSYVKSGTEVCRLVVDRVLKLRVPVPERYSSAVRTGQPVEVWTAAYAQPFPGKVKRINPAIDASMRAFEVEIHIENSAGKLKPGGFAKAMILTQVDEGVPTVPLEAVVRFAGVNKIFLIEAGKAREVPVTLGVQDTKWMEVASPALPANAQVVTSGQSALADGVPVQLRNPSTSSAR
ncbi:MAG: efflux RND transporter periplasmic adaptor subunit [Gemmataceae bacterium]